MDPWTSLCGAVTIQNNTMQIKVYVAPYIMCKSETEAMFDLAGGKSVGFKCRAVKRPTDRMIVPNRKIVALLQVRNYLFTSVVEI